VDWSDEADFEAARRGLVDRLRPGVVHDRDGRVVFDVERFGFLDADRPDSVHPSLWRQCQLLANHGLFEVVPGVYQVRGLDLSNMTIIEGESGIVVVDPLTCVETAAAALALYRRNRGDRAVTAVVYTHSHVDHFGGVEGVVERTAVSQGRVSVVAPAGFMEETVSEHVFAGAAMNRRAVFQAGSTLEAGPMGSVGLGLGLATPTGTISLMPPTVEVTHTGQHMWLDGVEVVFQMAPNTEAPAEMNLYLPGLRVLLVAENANHSLHNVLTPRGALVRDAHAWANSLTEALELFGAAEVLIGSHTWPTWGNAELSRMLSEQRDAYAYIHDQTVRLMNRGLTSPEIAEELAELPDDLGRAWHLRGYYGSVSNNVKAVYQRYMGWYDGNPAHLWQHPPTEVGRRYLECLGGPDAVVALAATYVERADHRFAAELLAHVVFAEPDHAGGRELQARVFTDLGLGAENAVWRNIFLTGAREQRGQSTRPARAGYGGTRALIAGMTIGQLFQLMSLRVDGPRAAGRRLRSRWVLTDLAQSWTLSLLNGVLTPTEFRGADSVEPDVMVTLDRAVLERLVTGQLTIDEAAVSGLATVDGDATALSALFDLLDWPRATFNVAMP
jgi:alkyl sulfatase BDS1-like metallo-beta-lactamase superfamily hydrolase